LPWVLSRNLFHHLTLSSCSLDNSAWRRVWKDTRVVVMGLNTFTLSLLNFLCGVLIGIYLPLAGLYFLRFVRKTPFGFRLWKARLRVVLVLFGFLLVFMVIGVLRYLEGSPEATPEEYVAWLGWGAIFGFFAGTILFFVGVWKGWRARAAQR